MVILVQNIGDSTLKSKVSAENTKMDLKIAKHKNEKVKLIGNSTTMCIA